MTRSQIIDTIQRVRAENNTNWMDLLRIAMEHAPKETKATLAKINKADKQISKLVGKLAKAKK